MEINDTPEVFEELLTYLRRSRGFDFTGYKRSSLMRRVRKQMQSYGLSTFGDYLDYLQVHPEEFSYLFDTLLINVTSFFRDAHVWSYLHTVALPKLISQKADGAPIRIWSAGCASGEEAYTIAIVLADILGIAQFRQRVKIYATDVDKAAIDQARQANYEVEAIQTLPVEWRKRYFEPVSDDRVTLKSDLRRGVIFGCHNLIHDAPISRLDLLLCRNTLMYFNAEMQTKILERFHFSLNENSILFLGKAEMLLSHTHLFMPISLQHRLFQRVPLDIQSERQRTLPISPPPLLNTIDNYVHLQEALFETIPYAQVVVDSDGKLVLTNAQARLMFSLSPLDQGRAFRDLDLSYRPVELRSPINHVYSNRSPLTLSNVSWEKDSGQTQYFDVQLVPLEDQHQVVMGVSIAFLDVTRYHSLRYELEQSNQELETANEELHSSNEELETTNEELQSTNEELETSNEALQLGNEALETINEKLRATNEALANATRMKDEFLANMSHELRTPLNAILGMTELLQEKILGPINEKQFQSLQTIQNSGNHLLDLITDLLDLTTIETGQVGLERTFLDISSLCQSSLAFVRNQAHKKNIGIVANIPSDLPEVLLDKRRIRQALLNLLQNAIKFTPEGGTATIEVTLTSVLPSGVNLSLTEPYDTFLRISVTDTGIGISPESLTMIFQPFTQVDSGLNRQYDGVGLGLSLVKHIAELHGGQITATSTREIGSCFTLVIPCNIRPS
ncbi:MAG: PAS domain-containing protein [Symploca sp. SIO2B6]|nr:PAS domain-containing protein [Symploca sp. SIO2B6]